jgi:hypothetical protein
MAFRKTILGLGMTAALVLQAAQAPAIPASQSPAIPSDLQAPPPQGLQAAWDVRPMLAELDANNQKLKPLLEEMHPQQWISNGAPTAYANQYYSAKNRMNEVINGVNALSRQTDSLALALDLYFRMEVLELTARSLEEGIRKYGERSTADQLSTLLAQYFSKRQKFRDYMHELAMQKEQDFKIADEEAQRCRGMISREPPPEPAPTRKTRRK